MKLLRMSTVYYGLLDVHQVPKIWAWNKVIFNLQYFVFTKFFKRDFYNIPANVEVDAKGDIKVDEFQNTSNEIVHAVGDVTGVWQLTPVAIGAGRKLAHR